MSSKKVVNITPAPAIPIKVDLKSGKNVREYDPKRLEDHVLFRFQPTHIAKVRKDAYSAEQVKQLQIWWSGLEISNRPGPFIPDPQGAYILWTFCGGDDMEGGYGDDCE